MNSELILKLPENKPPCICILFEREYDAQSLNYVFVTQHYRDNYKILFDIHRDGNLSLLFTHPDKSGLRYRYENLKYDNDKLKRFIENTKECTQFTFCHIVNDKSRHRVVKTIVTPRLWVLKVAWVEVYYQPGG